jgi:hypothetical protein
MMKNAATAPLIYFDSAPVRGSFNGNIEVEVAARYLMPKPDGSVTAEMVCVAHLRCSPQSAAFLIESLQHAIDMVKQQQEMLADQPHDDYARERQTN